jgi:hypothetical protein
MTLRTVEADSVCESSQAAARALRCAKRELQQLVASIGRRYVDGHRGRGPDTAQDGALCWFELLEIEDQVFGDLGFQGRHDPAIVASFTRLRDSRLQVADLHAPIDWCQDDDDMPVVMLAVRDLMQSGSQAAGN